MPHRIPGAASTPHLDFSLNSGKQMRMPAARLIGRRIRHAVVRLDDVVREHPGLDFFAADIGEHLAIDLHTWTQRLAALFNHLRALRRIVDDVTVLIRQIVFFQNGADAVAPAARRFQIGDNCWFVHCFAKIGFPMAK